MSEVNKASPAGEKREYGCRRLADPSADRRRSTRSKDVKLYIMEEQAIVA